jgi:DNA (cytosine-5)-methyltransferase 1
MSAADGKKAYGVKLVRGPFVRLPPHRDACSDEQQLLELVKHSERPLAADLFCGAGGLSLGLQQAGFNVVLGVDNDAEALETHRALCPGLSVNWDLADEAVVRRVAAVISSAIRGRPTSRPPTPSSLSLLGVKLQSPARALAERLAQLLASDEPKLGGGRVA